MNPLDSLRILGDTKDRQNPFINQAKIAVVGNAGVSAYDNGVINKTPCVVRFNNFATREKIQLTQKPRRCEILFTTFDLHSKGVSPTDVVIGVPFPFKAEEIKDKPQAWYPESRLWMVNPYWGLEMCDDLGINPSKKLAGEFQIDTRGWKHPFPSVGFTALWHMNKMGININSQIYVCGFSWYYDKETGLLQGLPLNKQPQPTHFNHNYWNEALWIARNLYKKTGWIFSPDCSMVLDKVLQAA